MYRNNVCKSAELAYPIDKSCTVLKFHSNGYLETTICTFMQIIINHQRRNGLDNKVCEKIYHDA